LPAAVAQAGRSRERASLERLRARAARLYGLQSRADDTAIFVAPQGIGNAWPNTGGRDVAFTQKMLDVRHHSERFLR
jgi:hypothetical protein